MKSFATMHTRSVLQGEVRESCLGARLIHWGPDLVECHVALIACVVGRLVGSMAERLAGGLAGWHDCLGNLGQTRGFQFASMLLSLITKFKI